VYLDEFMAFMVAEAAKAEGTAGTVSAEEVAASGPPVSTALACRVLGACIKERGLQQRTQPCWRSTLLIGPSHLLQADHCYSTWLYGKYSNHGEQMPKGRLIMHVLKMSLLDK
jgi:hypothetical protein